MGKLIVDDITRQIYCVSTPLLDVSNVNAGSSGVFTTYNCINTSPTFNVGGFTINQANGITVPVRGLYMICFNCYMFSSADRENVMVSVSVGRSRICEIACVSGVSRVSRCRFLPSSTENRTRPVEC